ncbi:hypothetical protein [Brasilonema bromeliae]|nr:hypothetical protein [Brasilonema bromeliae]
MSREDDAAKVEKAAHQIEKNWYNFSESTTYAGVDFNGTIYAQ